MSKRIPIDEAQSGMSLAADVIGAGGGRLLPKGGVLTAGQLDALRRKGILEINVEVADGQDADHLQRERERAVERLSHLFRRVEDEPLMQQLKVLLIEYRLEEASESGPAEKSGGAS